MKAPFRHALQVLEYERAREVLTSYAASYLGRKRIEAMQPLQDADHLRRLHAETREMREYLVDQRLPLSGLSDVCGDLSGVGARGRPAEPELLCRVVDLLRAGVSLRQSLRRDPARFPHLAELAAGIEDLPELREEIPASVDAREVRDSASQKLAEVRARLRELREKLRASATATLKKPSLRKAFQAEGVTVKNDRYLLPVKSEFRSWIHGPVRDRSQSGATLYIEPEVILLDGDRLLELLDRERDEVLRLLWELTRRVLDSLPTLERIQERLETVDFTYAKASYAEAFGLESPEIDTDGVLEIKEGRHPYLMWLARDVRRDHRDLDLDAIRRRVVPLTVRLGERAKLLIITGPNTGGKTVALKTIGLNVLLALSGVPIAAEHGTRIPVYRDVFVDIGDEQSIEQNLSTFSSHLRQIVEVLRHAGKRSLILLDELGSGTDPLEGAALGNALLDHFRQRSWNAIITTHLGSLKQYAYLHESAENAAMEFDHNTLRPTYRLLMGVPGRSNALAIAKRLGVRSEIIDAASEEMTRTEEPTREIISRMERSSRQAEKERRRAERARRRVQNEARAYEERLQEVQARTDALQREADLEVDRIVRSAKNELAPLVAKLKNVPQSHRALVDELESRLETLLVTTPLGQRREAFARSLRKEDEVYVPKFSRRGKVKKINKGERILTVLLGGIPTEVGFDDVSWIEGPPES